MAEIKINIPDGAISRVVNAICRQYGYRDTDDKGNPNPETKAQFARRQVIEWVRRTVRNAEAEEAREQAARDAIDKVNREVEIT